MIRALARQQQAAGLPVAVGIITTPSWRDRYQGQFETLCAQGIKGFSCNSWDVPFSLAFPAHMAAWRVLGSPLRRWAEAFARDVGVTRCVLHCHNAWLSGSYLPVRSRKITVGAVATYHGIQGAPQLREQPLRRRLHRHLAERFIRHGGVLASVDGANVTVAKELFGIDPKRFAIVPNGVPASPRKGCPYLQGAREFTVGHVGTLNEGKGWKLTALAVDAARKQGLPIRLILAGDGPQSRQAERWCAERPEYCEFLGRVANAALTVMPRLDAFCLLSVSEGMPMAALEALAAGVPVLATEVGGLSEVVRDAQNGYLIPRSSASLAELLVRIVSCKAEHQRLHRGAWRSFQQRYHISLTDRRYRALYGKSLAGGDAASPTRGSRASTHPTRSLKVRKSCLAWTTGLARHGSCPL